MALSSKQTMDKHAVEDDNNNHLETDGLLTMSLPIIATVVEIPDDNENVHLMTCRFCGEGDGDDYDDEECPDAPGGYDFHAPMNVQYRIAKNNNNNNNNNRLIRPCKCKGSMLYVHIDCLNRWRAMSPRQESFFACDLCGYQYDLRRPLYATIITHTYFVHTITTLCVISLILAMAYFAKVLHVFVFNQQPMPDDPDWVEWHGRTVLWMDRVYLAVGVVFVSALGVLYTLYLSLVVATSSETPPGSLPWLTCCDQSGCSWYGCYFADVAVCNGDTALGGLIILVAFLAMMSVAFGIAGAAFGVYTAIESIVQRIAGQVKERILEVTL